MIFDDDIDFGGWPDDHDECFDEFGDIGELIDLFDCQVNAGETACLDDITIMGTVSESGEGFIFRYRPIQSHEVITKLGEFAGDPDIGLTYVEAVEVANLVRQRSPF
ncbi:MAG: hypothetical protein AAGJ40_09475 [Planctomycetota bacterium]